ncbi:carbonic anhydrase [Actinoplanes sp. NEAU-A12]|uniref:Carbonic anhydrase n=1 Tax=Actinoplanes sandaracinus TaxID=3045177 RepID=A0ABT6WX62_9ACTN|nr:carbonic anhydrase [Actinoplanes sandaracinus]MDI6104324.1 carbonic anhydrase [Actinoplanes sandaracinus]
MHELLQRARSFQRQASFEGSAYRKLAEGQQPQVLFISCSDSRIIPALIMGARPGEVFELRNAGNIVAPHSKAGASGEAATIEYALEVLKVQHVVVCGHSHCGAMGALKKATDLSGLPAVGAWLDLARPALASVIPPAQNQDEADPAMSDIVQLNVRHQLSVLCAYPSARRLLDEDRLQLHGWYYEVDTGQVHELGDDGSFRVHAG